MIDTWAGSGQRSRHVPGKWPAAAVYVLLTLLLTYPLSLKPDRTVLAHYPDDELLMWVLAHEVIYKELRSFPDVQSLQHLKQLGVTYVIAHIDRFPPGELARFEEGVRSFDAQLKLEFLEPAGRVYSLR